MISRRPYVRPSRAATVPLSRAPNYAAPAVLVVVPKAVVLRSEPYRRWVASLPCLACRIVGFSQAAHANEGKGMAMKACDSRLFPLCGTRPGHMGHHAEHDLCIGMSREARRLLEACYVANTMQRAADAGWDLATLTRKA